MLQTGNLLMKTTNNYFHSHAPVHLVHHHFLKSGIAYELIDNFIAGGGGGEEVTFLTGVSYSLFSHSTLSCLCG